MPFLIVILSSIAAYVSGVKMKAISIIFIMLVVSYFIFLGVQQSKRRREAARCMDILTKLNRERIDKPDWKKQPWQHDPKELREKSGNE